MNRVGLYQFKKYRIMNKTYKSGMMALSAVVFFTSCSESESLQQAHLSTDQINFIASMAHQWDANTKSAPQNPSSRSAGERDNEAPIHVNANLAKPLYLHPGYRMISISGASKVPPSPVPVHPSKMWSRRG